MSDRSLLLQEDGSFRTLRVRPGSSGLVLDGLTGDYEYGLEVKPRHRKRLETALLRWLRTQGVDTSAEYPLIDLLKVAYERGLFHRGLPGLADGE